LGGDDFDEALADLAMAGHDSNELSQSEHFRLLVECRMKKEALHPNTRKIVLDLDHAREGWGAVTIPAADYYERCRHLVEETLRVTEDLLVENGIDDLEAMYVTGGGSELPIVNRMLKERFGRRVSRSVHARSATAIGLAIQADHQAGYVLRDKFSRYFGVWRESDSGRRVVFDPLFSKGAVLPRPSDQPLEIRREYTPVHNIGDFRYIECTYLVEDGQPGGDVTIWDEIRFPFDPALQAVEGAEVQHSEAVASQRIEERYSTDASGAVTVTIANLTAGYSRQYRLGRWASRDAASSKPRVRHRAYKPAALRAKSGRG
jgi:molecular chaperone DnaK (HSP70)